MVTPETFERVLEFAIKAHKGQRRKGDKRPYILHPIAVMSLILQLKDDSTNIYLLGSAALLHDTVEDCGVTLAEIAKEFDYEIAALVKELTSDQILIEIMGKTAYLSKKVVEMSSYALTLKLADRYHNVYDMQKMSAEFKEKYIEQTITIINYLQANRPRISVTQDEIIQMIKAECRKYENLTNK